MKTKRALTIAAFVLLNLVIASVARAEVSPCGTGVQTRRVTYFSDTTNVQDSRTDPGDTEYKVRLRGSLHYKTLEPGEVLKNRPVLIFNHGHEQERGEACAIVKYFTSKNWVVFVPLRRGHYLDKDDDNDGVNERLRSTGIYIDDFVSACGRSFLEASSSNYLTNLYCGSNDCRAEIACGTEHRDSAVELGYLNEQRIDVRDQISYIKSYPAIAIDAPIKKWKLADPDQIVILGHSYGGGLMVFTNAHDYGQSVAIDIQGAELSWDNEEDPYWSIDLRFAMHEQKRPMFLLQPRNGKSLNPTKNLFAIAVDQQYRSQAAIFPNAPCTDYATNSDGEKIPVFPPCPGTDDLKQVHGSFIGHAEQVENWGPSVIEFAKRYPRN